MKKLIIIILFLLSSIVCKSQTIYTSLMIDPIILVGGPQINILINNIDTEGSYSIGIPPWSKDQKITKVLFESYQIGLGYKFKEKLNINGLILTPFISYNKINHKYYNISYGTNILFEISKRFHIITNIDIKIWSVKTGLGIKL